MTESRTVHSGATLRRRISALVLVAGAFAAGTSIAGLGPSTEPTPSDLVDSMRALEVTSRIARMLDELSNAANEAEEDAILEQIEPLLHPDIVVITDGREFVGREQVLAGMRFAHSRLQDEARRLETNPVLLSSSSAGGGQSLTLGTVQQHWWRDTATSSLLMVNRKTELTIEKTQGQWLVTRNVLETVTGPVEMTEL